MSRAVLESHPFDSVAVLQLNAPPLNTLTVALLDELRAAIGRAGRDPAVAGVIITGGPDHFSAGADVHLFRQIDSPEDAVRLARTFQDAFQAIEDSPKPVAAAMAGRVIGGALELAMACHVRVAAHGTRFTMPEVRLGINPGSGGTQRLPRLVGPEAALRMLLTAETVDAERARAIGLVDAVGAPDALLARAAELVRSAGAPRRTTERIDQIRDDRARSVAYDKALEWISQTRPEIIAPRKILEAVRIGLEQSVEAGLRAEQRAFAQCMDTLATRNKIHLFFATRATARLPELEGVEASPIRRAAVVGMGTMGTGIAHAFAQAGVPVVALDESPTALEAGIERIRQSLHKRVHRGKLAPEQADRTLALVSTTMRWEELADADLIVESVFEDAAVKRSVIKRLEAVCPADAILASNTSTISLDALAEGIGRPERLVGMHFFNPAHRMPLVEIIRRGGTSPRVLSGALDMAKRLGKTPVVVANREGFLVNRLFVPYLQEAFFLLEEGAEPAEIDAAAVEFGFPMGPLVLIDMAGLDILVHAQRVLASAFPRHGPLSAIATRLVERGHLGQKTGSGVYRYQPGSRTPQPSEATAGMVAEVRRAARRIDRSEIVERLVLRMVNEAFFVLQEGIARCESDLDVAMVLGTGFPDFRGGVHKYAIDRGLGGVRAKLEELAERWGERFSPSERLMTQCDSGAD